VITGHQNKSIICLYTPNPRLTPVHCIKALPVHPLLTHLALSSSHLNNIHLPINTPPDQSSIYHHGDSIHCRSSSQLKEDDGTEVDHTPTCPDSRRHDSSNASSNQQATQYNSSIMHFDCLVIFLTFILSYNSDVRFQDVEDLHTYRSSWEAIAQIISCPMKYTRGRDVIYIAILADQSVRLLW
jgi:hypothetical protein